MTNTKIHTLYNQRVKNHEINKRKNQHGQQSTGPWLHDVWEYRAAVRFCWQHCIPGTRRTWVISQFPLCTEVRAYVFDDRVCKTFRQLTSDNAELWLNEYRSIGTQNCVHTCVIWFTMYVHLCVRYVVLMPWLFTHVYVVVTLCSILLHCNWEYEFIVLAEKGGKFMKGIKKGGKRMKDEGWSYEMNWNF